MKGPCRSRKGSSPLLAATEAARRFEQLRLCSEGEFAFLFGRGLRPKERRALREALELMQNGKRRGHKDPTPADILEQAFGRPTAREMLQRRGHPFTWAARYCMLRHQGQDLEEDRLNHSRSRAEGAHSKANLGSRCRPRSSCEG